MVGRLITPNDDLTILNAVQIRLRANALCRAIRDLRRHGARRVGRIANASAAIVCHFGGEPLVTITKDRC